MTFTFSQRMIKPDCVLVRILDGEAVLLNLDNEIYFGLDEVGTRMWMLLTGSDSIQAAYDGLLAEYEVDPATLRADLIELIQQLLENGLTVINEQ